MVKLWPDLTEIREAILFNLESLCRVDFILQAWRHCFHLDKISMSPVQLGLEWRIDSSGQQHWARDSFLGSKLGSLLHECMCSFQHACQQHEHPSILVSACEARGHGLGCMGPNAIWSEHSNAY